MTNKTPSFNDGWLCTNCGVIPKLKKKTILKKEFQVCPNCERVTTIKWSKPLNERPGRCSNCGHGSFTLALWKGNLLNKCKQCDQVKNVDTGEIKRPGKKEFKC